MKKPTGPAETQAVEVTVEIIEVKQVSVGTLVTTPLNATEIVRE